MADRGFAEIDGGQLYYERNGGGPALLFTGGLVDVRMWEPQIDTLSQDYSLILCDLRGYGRSSMPSGAPYRHCHDLAALLGELGIDTVCIGGQSMGGTVALDFALAYPQMVHALILAPVLPLLGWEWVEGLPVKPAIDVGISEGPDAFRNAFLELPLNATAMAEPGVAQLLREMLDDYSGWHLQHRDPGGFAEPNAIDRLDEIDAPALVVVGEHDVLDARLAAEHVAAALGNAELHILEGVGHYPNLEDPPTVNSLAVQFLSRVQSSA